MGAGDHVGDHARLLPGGGDQPIDDTVVLRAFTEREHVRIGDRPQLFIDDDAALRPQARGGGETDLRLHPAGEHEQLTVEDVAVGEFHRGHPPADRVHPGERRADADVDS